METWKQRVRKLKKDTYAIYLACQDIRVPWYARILAVCAIAYAFSPIDLIPDFIPILGYLDDLLIVPLGIMLVIRMIPADILAECRQKAERAIASGEGKPTNWLAAFIIIAIWVFTGILILMGIKHILNR